MKILIFAPRAARDIDEIYDYTAGGWGLVQAERYIGAIRARCETLATGAIIGRDASRIRPGYRRIETGSHVIFYRAAANRIEIIRILHASMDFGRHL